MENSTMSIKTGFGKVTLVMRVESGSKNNKTVSYPEWDGKDIDEVMFQIDQGEGGHPLYRYFRFKLRKADTLMGCMKDFTSAYTEVQKAQKSAPTEAQKELSILKARIAELEGTSTPVNAASRPRRKTAAK